MSKRGQSCYPAAAQNAKAWGGGSLQERMATYEKSIADPTAFWADIAQKEFYWQQPWNTVLDYNFHKSKGNVYVKWFEGGKTNMCYNCVDRHLAEHKDRVAFFWEGNSESETRTLTYGQLYDEVTRLAAVLKQCYGIKKGDRVSLYMPMILEAVISMMALARIGAVPCIVFGGFSETALADRMGDAEAKLLITVDGTYRGDKSLNLKAICDKGLALVEKQGLHPKCLVFNRLGAGKPCKMKAGRDAWWHEQMASVQPDPSIEWLDAEDPLFILYTSGSTGKPKGVVHTAGGYMVYAGTTYKYVFDYHENDVYFCTADIGWITGHTYVVYGPLLNRATSVLFEGLPNYPTVSRWWQIIERYKVSLFYTAPTAIRSLMANGEGPVNKCDLSTLRVLGSVGEPINVAAWEFYYHVIGKGRCDIIDSWWQTETGGVMITPLPGSTAIKPGSATLPFFGVVPVLLDSVTLKEKEGAEEGLLCIKYPWPGIGRTVYKDHARYEKTYFEVDGYYLTGDGARRDNEGYYWLTGRVDDVLKVSGHRLGTAEIESAINMNPAVAESAVVGIPHKIKGEGIYAFVTFKQGVQVSDELINKVRATVRATLGPLATPDHIHPAPHLPKTRSGKIMRRVLRKISVDEKDYGDISTLAEPGCVQELVELKAKWVNKKGKGKGKGKKSKM